MYPDMLATATYLPGTEYILVTDGCVKINLLGFTENLLEFSDVIPRHHRDSEHPINVLSGWWQPATSLYADGRSSGDVIAF